MLRQLKINSIVLVILLFGILIYQLFYFDPIQINVKPSEVHEIELPELANYEYAVVNPSGKIQMKHLSVWQRVIAPISNSDFQTSNLIIAIVYTIVLYLMIDKIIAKGMERNTHKYYLIFNFLGYGILTINLVNYFINKYFDAIIRDVTQNQFILDRNNATFFYVLILGLVILWFGRVLKKIGFK